MTSFKISQIRASSLCVLSICAATSLAQSTPIPPKVEQVAVNDHRISGPGKPEEFSKWIKDMKQWRTEQLAALKYSGKEYERPELLWTQSSFMQPQMMIEDRYFYDPVAGKYTVDRYLDDLDKRYGGIDSVLVWPTYSNIGIDNRNQYDMFGDMPGGVAGIRQMVADFHRRGVRVLFPIMPWDKGTRDAGMPLPEAIAQEMAAVGADGINGDTMQAIPMEFREASDKAKRPLAFEAEVFGVDNALAFNNMGWAYAVPIRSNFNVQNLNVGAVDPQYVEKYKWMEPRHMAHIDDRWQRDKIVDLQYAFFNGIGMETWENVWGIWNGMTPRDSEATRHISAIERRYAPLLVSQEWEPHTPMLRYGVYASKWPGKEETLWTIVSKNEFDVAGEQIKLPYKAGQRYFDLWHGMELKPDVRGDHVVLSFTMEGHGFGALLAVDTPPADFTAFLKRMHQLGSVRLDSLSAEYTVLPQTVVENAPTKAAATAPEGMVKVPAGRFDFQVAGVEIEGGNLEGVDVQYPWETTASRHHFHTMQVSTFYMDRYPVTNAAFKSFLDATHYQPKDDHNFLKDWENGNYPNGWAGKPVTWVSMEDARAYAAWAGKRLPHEWEWQYAAQGIDGRRYPWGNEWNAAMVPAQDKSRTMRGPDDVSAHPQGASPFGVEDMAGNVWQWTDEYRDEHTRAAVLRGGSYYKPQGSVWYFPNEYELQKHGKYLLMAPGKDRSGALGFRCVMDATP